MRVFVAGATGAIGRRLIPVLVERGHAVVGMTRSVEQAGLVRELGGEPVVADALDKDEVRAAVVGAEPEVVIHQLTALKDIKSVRRWDHEFAMTNRLRTEGLDNLLAAARLVGARRFVAQSFGNWNYERSGGPVKTEDDPLDPAPPASMSRTLEAIRHVESAVLGQDDIEGVALRYGNLYGPADEMPSFLDMIRRRLLPVIGDGGGVWSFVHLEDAAGATALALEPGASGVYNVADSDPAPVSVWLPELARVLGAPPPRHVPVWLGRLATGAAGVSLFTEIRGASNARARRELGWELRHPSWRDGFRRAIVAAPATPENAHANTGS